MAIFPPQVPADTQAILLWRDIKKSGICFGGSTAAYVLLAWAPLSFSVLGLQAATILVATTLLWSLVGNALGKSGPPVPDVLCNGIHEEELAALVKKYLPLLNKGLTSVGAVLCGKDYQLSLKVFAAGFVLSWIAARISLLTAGYIIVFLAFTAPKVYELKQKEIDSVLQLANGKAKELYAQLDEKVLKKVMKSKPAAKTQ